MVEVATDTASKVPTLYRTMTCLARQIDESDDKSDDLLTYVYLRVNWLGRQRSMSLVNKEGHLDTKIYGVIQRKL
jgi:hypothetical protein